MSSRKTFARRRRRRRSTDGGLVTMERGDAFQTRIPKLPLSSTRENAMKVEGTDFEENEDGAMRKKKKTTTTTTRRRRNNNDNDDDDD